MESNIKNWGGGCRESFPSSSRAQILQVHWCYGLSAAPPPQDGHYGFSRLWTAVSSGSHLSLRSQLAAGTLALQQRLWYSRTVILSPASLASCVLYALRWLEKETSGILPSRHLYELLHCSPELPWLPWVAQLTWQLSGPKQIRNNI